MRSDQFAPLFMRINQINGSLGSVAGNVEKPNMPILTDQLLLSNHFFSFKSSITIKECTTIYLELLSDNSPRDVA